MDNKETNEQIRNRMFKKDKQAADAKKANTEAARKEAKEKEVTVIDRPRGDGDRPWLRTAVPNNRIDKILKDAGAD